MNDSIDQVKTVFDGLLNNISKPRRRLLYQQIGRELARSQRRRIKAQQNPDGTAYEPRKKPKKGVKGRIKSGRMFEKITQPRFMRLRLENEGVSLGYEGGNAVIARIHQEGLVGRVRKDWHLKVKYASRELLGFTYDDVQMIEDYVIRAISGSAY
ncbi:virion morphogenesis protein [Mannheimia granulomatis]|uniref:Virion morphogenesis protein n=1 Tax=Mannheimia granulomatis TaxID=85402 RepID=A0A011P597_9PAST|nr:phage virion morphogenesis protein [Mannheimia granulomatis]EXI61674.1 virion morphogenesis protein [Mannheimia granulomatis]RGE48269.1 virion morphogenesis protein [Mannheimia granulomatis]